MNPKQIIAGIDIGGTNTAIGIMDLNKNLLIENSFITNSIDGFDKFLLNLKTKINDLAELKKNNFSLLGLGIAAPSANHFKGTIEGPSNLNWGKVDIIKELRKHYKIPIIIDNDANAAALGELNFGIAKGMKNFIILTLGTGLGSGIVINEKIFYGANGLAGEFGHTIIEGNGRACNCGNFGCLETYISANGMKRTVFQFLSHFKDESVLRNISYNDLTSRKIYDEAKNNDPIALKTFEFTGEILGRAISNFVGSFDPEAIILFGGLADAGDLLLKPTRKSFKNNVLDMYKGKTKLLISNLQNSKAAVLGAGTMIINFLNNNINVN
jgi:glucokinase